MSRSAIRRAFHEALDAFVPELTAEILAKADECAGGLDAYMQAVKEAADLAIGLKLAAQRAETEASRLHRERVAQDAEREARFLEFRDSPTPSTVH